MYTLYIAQMGYTGLCRLQDEGGEGVVKHVGVRR